MLNLGEYHSNSKHMNISIELKAINERFRNFPTTVKSDVSKNVEGNKGMVLFMHIHVHAALSMHAGNIV